MAPPVEHNDELTPVLRRATAPDHLLHRPETRHNTVTLYAGKKPFQFRTDLLVANSPYFQKVLAELEGHDGSEGNPEQLTFETADEVAMSLLQRWLLGEKLGGPNDFHSFQHWLGLYVLARKFEVEALENEVTDSIRHYYFLEKMTASPLRLEYIYTYTAEPNLMRKFLVETAAYRTLCEPDAPLSGSLRGVLEKNSEMAMDFIEAVVTLHHNGLQDVRKEGNDCAWHVHAHSPPCAKVPGEAWQADGALGL